MAVCYTRCPVDDGIFPSLDRARNGEGLEASFNAFKIPESNFLVFEATVKSCRGGCQPVTWYISIRLVIIDISFEKIIQQVFCNTNNVPGRGSGQSYGRKRRDATASFALNNPAWSSLSSISSSSSGSSTSNIISSTMKSAEDANEEELVMEMLRVHFISDSYQCINRFGW